LSGLLERLRSDGVVKSPAATLTPLTGGVSSEIYRVDDGADVFVVKRALAKLKVQQDWFADVGRNANEFRYLQYVSQFLPQAVPRPLRLSVEHGYFTMEYLGSGYANWKQQMLAGVCEEATAGQIGSMLGIIHKRSADDAEARDTFATLKDFEQLRIDPYLLATAKKHPDLAGLFHEEADRLRASRRVLTHGDFSPKNILVSKDRLVLVDCEVAWFGDAAFDVAFGLNHLLLKRLARPQHADQLRRMAQAFWTSYQKAAGSAGGSETEVARLLLMLMLARVDGKSPVEYLDEAQRRHVRTFAIRALKAGRWKLDACMTA
jgi:aminoglycoside phosphotransferase (APT) family kinase protein